MLFRAKVIRIVRSLHSINFNFFVLNVDEHNEDSFIGRDDFFVFFSRKSLKICSGSILIFRGLSSDFLISVHFLCQKKANSTIEHKIVIESKKDKRSPSELDVSDLGYEMACNKFESFLIPYEFAVQMTCEKCVTKINDILNEAPEVVMAGDGVIDNISVEQLSIDLSSQTVSCRTNIPGTQC